MVEQLDDTKMVQETRDELIRLQSRVKELERKLQQARNIVVSICESTKKWVVLPKEWWQDSEIIHTALMCTGYANLPKAWRSDSTVIVQAMEMYHSQNISSILPWKNIPTKGISNRKVVLKALELYPYFLVHWKDVPKSLQNDSEIALRACNCGMVKVNEIACLQDRAVLRSAVNWGEIKWTLLPESLTRDIGFARSLSCFSYVTATTILESFPILCQERDIWMRIVNSERYNKRPIIRKFAPVHILSDGEIMLAACERDPSMLSMIHSSLWNKKTFVEGVLKFDATALLKMPPEKQIVYTDSIASHVLFVVKHERHRQSSFSEYYKIAQVMLPELWNDRRIAKAWFQAGLPYFDDYHPGALKEDREIFHLIGSHCRWPGSFRRASPKLRGEKAFMQQVMAADVSRFVEATKDLQQDFDLALQFVGMSPKSEVKMHFTNDQQKPDESSIANMKVQICEQLANHHGFFDVFLFGFLHHRCSFEGGPLKTSHCALTMLDQGGETSAFFKKLISEFVGVPAGKSKVYLLRRALLNITS